MAKKMYFGVLSEVPIYAEGDITETLVVDSLNIYDLFDVVETVSGGYAIWESTQYSLKMTEAGEAQAVLTARYNMDIVFPHALKIDNSLIRYGYLTIGDSEIFSHAGHDISGTFTGHLAKGQSIVMRIVSLSGTPIVAPYIRMENVQVTYTAPSKEIVGYETRSIARKAKKMYLGVEGENPIYKETPVFVSQVMDGTNISEAFTVSDESDMGMGGFSWNGTEYRGVFTSEELTGKTIRAVLTAKVPVKVSFSYKLNVYHSAFDKGTLTVGSVDVFKNSIGDQSGTYSAELSAGESIILQFYTGNEVTDPYIYIKDMTAEYTRIDKEIIGYETGGGARKIKKGYIGDQNGLARLFFNGMNVRDMAITYTGNYTDQADMTINGISYRLLTLTSSGTLTLGDPVVADIWMCSGGNAGMGDGFPGGGGGPFLQTNNHQVPKSVVCVVGAGAKGGAQSNVASVGGISSFGTLSTPVIEEPSGTNVAAEACGASGGGRGGNTSGANRGAGLGCGVSTVPFFDTTIFEQHSAGGGGGACRIVDSEGVVEVAQSGGKGGSNGSGGSSTPQSTTSANTNAAGGVKGGGTGGNCTSTKATSGGNATFYGSGGGGGARTEDAEDEVDTYGSGGAGYQGIIYVRIPYEQENYVAPEITPEAPDEPEVPDTTIPVTFTGTGNSSYCYVSIGGTKYTDSSANPKVSAGDVITFGVYGYSTTYYGQVTIDGESVVSSTGKTTKTYDWTVPDGTTAIEIDMSYTSTTARRNGKIKVTTN